MTDHRPQVVVLGAGFGGLAAARALAGAPVDVLLLDRNNYHTFLPLLYQVAAAELEATEISYPVRRIVRQFHGVHALMAEATGLDLDGRKVETDGGPIEYDYLILATGSVPHYFGVEGAAEYAFPLYSLKQGLVLRNHIMRCFENAAREEDEQQRREMLTFAIVGGGPTGVEFAGALAELIHGPLVKDYPDIDPKGVQVILLEAMDRLLLNMPASLSAYTYRRLERMRVEVQLNTPVAQITARSVHLSGDRELHTRTVVWTAGVRANPGLADWGLPTARGGRVPVLPTLQVPGRPEVYAIGDIAYLEQDGRPLPWVAPAAAGQGETAARNVICQVAGQKLQQFRYRDLGSMATIGRNAAVAKIGKVKLTGFVAWAAWLVVHLVKLIGFRNRLFVLMNWAWDYFFFERAARLILPRDLSAPRDRALPQAQIDGSLQEDVIRPEPELD